MASEYDLIKGEIESLGVEIKSLRSPSPATLKVIKSRMDGLVSRLEGLFLVTPSEGGASITKSEAPDLADVLMVKSLGSIERCTDCNLAQCICFSHLSKPSVTLGKDGLIKVEFGSDFNNFDKLSYLKYMRYVITKKLEKV